MTCHFFDYLISPESNIALFKTVAASSVHGEYDPSRAVDGITEWSSAPQT